MVTDPPYGVDYDPNWRNEASRWSGSTVKLGASAIGKVSNDDRADWLEAWQLFPGNVAYVWHAGLRGGEVALSIRAAGFELRSQIIWNKTRLVIGRGNYHWQHEPCWYAVRKSNRGEWQGDRTQSTVWDIPKPKTSETGHSTQKPIECMKRPIENNSKPGDAVYEPFSGSGTTIIAAEMTGRKCYALEISPAYVDVAIQRWQTFTGLTATLASTGETYAATAKARALVAA
jgi:DNA modification methylase